VPTNIDREGVRRLLDEGAVLVEVLERSQYRAAHLPGAVHLPAWELTEERARELPSDRPLVLYCFDTQ
jgi:rhodanese-related sulfurtransferase